MTQQNFGRHRCYWLHPELWQILAPPLRPGCLACLDCPAPPEFPGVLAFPADHRHPANLDYLDCPVDPGHHPERPEIPGDHAALAMAGRTFVINLR